MVKRRAEGWGKAVPVKRRAVMMVVLAVLFSLLIPIILAMMRLTSAGV